MITHLLELRRRLLNVAFFFITCFLVCYYFSAEVLHYVMSPMMHILPQDESLVATQVTTPILIPLTLTADLAMLGTAPIALFHLWRFAAPGLYRHERRSLKLTMLLSITLFCMGVLFCFYGVLPFVLQLFVHAVPAGVRYMPEIGSTIDFMIRMMTLFGLCFQVPLVCILLVKTGLINIDKLKKGRPYWIVCAFVLGMLLTPPDVLSQVTLAIPLCLLYEIGILLSQFAGTKP